MRTWQAPEAPGDESDFDGRPDMPAEEGAMTLTLPSALARKLRDVARAMGTDPDALATVLIGQQVLGYKG